MSKWKRLNLARPDERPHPGQLVALRLAPTRSRAAFYSSERYDIGMFKADPNTGRKLWWHGARGCENPVRLKKHYDIWWCAVHEFDAGLGGGR